MKWENTGFPGVQSKAHETQKHGVKFDRYFRGRYQVGGKRVTIGFGWSSEGWTAKKVFEKVQEFRGNAKTGKGPKNLKEERESEAQRKDKIKAEKDKEARFNISFGQFFEETYLPQAKGPGGKKKDSWRKEQSHHNKWISPVIGNKALKDITPSDIERVKEKMFKAGLSERSIQYCIATIRQVFNKAIFLDLFKGENPVNKVKIPSPNNKRMKFLTKDEAQTLLAQLKPKNDKVLANNHDIALLSLHTGLRAGEIFNLKWNNLDFEQGLIHVREAKGNKDRIAYMTKDVKEMLEARKAHKNNDLVFPPRTRKKRKGVSKDNASTHQGKDLEKKRKGVSKVFYQAVKDSGLNDNINDDKDKVCFHTLRHTFASWQVQAGMDLYTVQKLMGHSTIAMTERYAHLAQENMKRATSIFDNNQKLSHVNKKQQ